MATMIVRFDWDSDKMGPRWFNMDNLKVCLFSTEYTRPEFLSTEILFDSNDTTTPVQRAETLAQQAEEAK
jgi:hypothetical protein